ncbi:MAG TPA: hypothetical protein VF288_10670 [Mycobacteriales bacterium]
MNGIAAVLVASAIAAPVHPLRCPAPSRGVALVAVRPVAEQPPPAEPAPPAPQTSWQSVVLSLGWDGPLMLRVAWCESRDEPSATEPHSGAHGLFQQLGEASDDPYTQVSDAYSLWQEQGYGAWAASRACWS